MRAFPLTILGTLLRRAEATGSILGTDGGARRALRRKAASAYEDLRRGLR